MTYLTELFESCVQDVRRALQCKVERLVLLDDARLGDIIIGCGLRLGLWNERVSCVIIISEGEALLLLSPRVVGEGL